MKVKVVKKDNTLTFDQLSVGDVFKFGYGDELAMKLKGDVLRAVYLTSAYTFLVQPKAPVIRIDGEFVPEEE